MLEAGGYNEGFLVAAHSSSLLSPSPDIHTTYTSPEGRPGEMLNPQGIPSAEPTRGKGGVTLARWTPWLDWPLASILHVHSTCSISLSLHNPEHPTSLRPPASWSSLPEPTVYSALESLDTHLALTTRLPAPEVRDRLLLILAACPQPSFKDMHQRNGMEERSKAVQGQTFINCSSCSCRRLRSSSSSSSLPLDLRLMSAPNSTAKTTSHVSTMARGSSGTSPPVLTLSGWQHCQQYKVNQSLPLIRHDWLASQDSGPTDKPVLSVIKKA